MRHIDGDHLFRDSDVSLDEQEAELNAASSQSQSSPPDFARLRAKTGYTAYQVSRFVGISTSRYVRIEKGLTKPMPDELESIEKFYSNKGAGV
jgi:DNA-binding XRE family transcriptional regulator